MQHGIEADDGAGTRELEPRLHGGEDFPDAEQPDHGNEEVEANQQMVLPEGHAQRAGHLVEPDGAQRKAQTHGRQHLERRASSHAHEAGEREEVDGEEFGRPECQRELGDQRGEERDHDHGHQRADEGGGEGSRQRLVGPALLRHGVTIEGCGHRPGFTGDIEEDGGDGSAEQGAPIDAGEHDDGGGGRHGKRKRQQDGDAVGAPEAGQDPDDDAEQDADQHQRDVVPGESDLEAANERVDLVHAFPFPSFPARQPGPDCGTRPLCQPLLVYIVPNGGPAQYAILVESAVTCQHRCFAR
jgi:hypothetical protein